jgi:dihydrofolate reductase
MTKLTVDISMSLDGFIAGPNQTLEDPLGRDGNLLHEWAFSATAWRESHGLSGGESNRDSEVIEEHLSRTGATVMGRRMFSGGEGPWEHDPNANGWWGDEPPFHHPVFVLTHHHRDPQPMLGGTTFTFVTEGVETALAMARREAGDKNVAVAGGAKAVQQYLNSGLLDEIQIHLVPVLLGGGVRLLDNVERDRARLECIRVVESPTVTHIKYRVVK